MTLIENWRLVLKKATSIKLSVLASILVVLQTTLPYYSDVIPPHLFGALGALMSLAAIVARLVAQEEL